MFKKMNNMFFDEPDKEVSVREYARLHGISPATASTYLKELTKQGYLKQRKERNLILFKANEESKAYKDAKVNNNITRIRSSGLIEELMSKLQQPLAIYLFGSYAKAENRKGSDIDLFIITRAKKQINLEKHEKQLGASIQLFVHTPEEIERIKLKNPNLLNNVLNGIKLSGFWEVFNV